MNNEKKDEPLEMIEILENAIVIFKDELKRIVDAIQITDEGVVTGFILNREVFVEGGFIPKRNIKHIEGGYKRLVYKKKF
jgi:hypothetical protein